MSANIHPDGAASAFLLSLYEAALLVFGQKLSALRAAG